MLQIGIKGECNEIVTEKNSAASMRSGELAVYATPSMIALIEETAWRSVAPQLESGMATVGTLLNVAHVAPTPVGMTVKCETELTEVDGRRLVFSVKVSDECGEIGRGTHERFIINEEKFQKKADAKKEA